MLVSLLPEPYIFPFCKCLCFASTIKLKKKKTFLELIGNKYAVFFYSVLKATPVQTTHLDKNVGKSNMRGFSMEAKNLSQSNVKYIPCRFFSCKGL